jgi:hypothetical protein
LRASNASCQLLDLFLMWHLFGNIPDNGNKSGRVVFQGDVLEQKTARHQREYHCPLLTDLIHRADCPLAKA